VRWSALLLLAPGPDPRGRACRGLDTARGAHDRAGRCLEWRPVGRAERDLLVRREHARPLQLPCQQLRRTCSV